MKLCLRPLIVLATLLLALAPAASATDGVILINQATAMRGLPGCAAHSGYLLNICQPGSYELSGNLTTNAGALAISSGGVNLNLNGFTITAGTTGILLVAPSGAAAQGPNSSPGVSIRGGAIAAAFAIQGPLNYGGSVSIQHLAIEGGLVAVDLQGTTAQLDHVDVIGARSGVQIGAGSVLGCSIELNPSSISDGLEITNGPAEISRDEINAPGGTAIKASGSVSIVSSVVNGGAYGILQGPGPTTISYGGDAITANAAVSGKNAISEGDNACNGAKC